MLGEGSCVGLPWVDQATISFAIWSIVLAETETLKIPAVQNHKIAPITCAPPNNVDFTEQKHQPSNAEHSQSIRYSVLPTCWFYSNHEPTYREGLPHDSHFNPPMKVIGSLLKLAYAPSFWSHNESSPKYFHVLINEVSTQLQDGMLMLTKTQGRFKTTQIKPTRLQMHSRCPPFPQAASQFVSKMSRNLKSTAAVPEENVIAFAVQPIPNERIIIAACQLNI